jgi:hypothetical protein
MRIRVRFGTHRSLTDVLDNYNGIVQAKEMERSGLKPDPTTETSS